MPPAEQPRFKMYAFVDETGNTGPNLFDPNQPEFLTAAVVTRSDFDAVYTKRLRQLCRKHGVDSLHASVLGLGPIEAMAPGLLRLLKKADARFFVSRVEKRYLLATKVFDTFFDSGENPAVPWDAYNIRPLRMALAFKVASLIDDDLAKLFWAMLMSKSEAKARAMIPEICSVFLSRVDALQDERTKQIVRDAFTWSAEHPEALDIFIAGRQAKNGHMPNMVAFKNLLEGLEHFSQRWKKPVRRIVHDRQSQFESTLAEWHRMTANASPEPLKLPGETHVLRQVSGSEFAVSASDRSAGIQIADCVLWIFRQFLNGKQLPPNTARLLSFVIRRAWQSDFSFKGVSQILNERYSEILSSELTPAQMAAAQQLRDGIEQRRQENMALYEEDGLMPYQRELRARPLPDDKTL